MKKLNIAAMLVGAALFTGLGVTSASAAMKCGAGKCGNSMEKPAKKAMKCGASMKKEAKKAMKCGASMKKSEEKAMKCGAAHMKKSAGKCGGKK